MNQEQASNILRQWRESAPHWEKHSPTIRMMFAPITRAIIEAAEIREGQSVIDIAGGTGEPSLAIARAVGPSGSVTCTDAVAEMLAAAEREAARLGLTNIRFKQGLADSLPFDDTMFDAAVCRLGVMLFPDPQAAIREIMRVIKPDGRMAFAVWSRKESNTFFSAVTDVMSRYVESPPEDPDAPGAFRFAEPGKLARLLDEAGAIDVSEQPLDFHIEAPLWPDEFWLLRVELSDTLREKVAQLSSKQITEAARKVKQAVLPFFADDKMSFPAQVIIVSAKKPRSAN